MPSFCGKAQLSELPMPEGKAASSGAGGAVGRDPSVTIRTFRPEDGPSVEAILRSSPQAAQWTQDAVTRFLTSIPGAYAHFFVAESGGAVTGFLMARQVAKEAEILNIAVLPAYRRSGQATELLREGTMQWNAGGVTMIFLEVRESNQAAIAFYEANGFTVRGRRPTYYREPEEAAICMMRKVTGFPVQD